jgi:hypothetical protein
MEECGMSGIDTQKRDDEEISLVDLLVVLLRRRRMICAVLLIGIIVAGGAWLVLRRRPAPQPGEPVVVEEGEGKIGMSFNPAAPVFIREGLFIFFYDPHLYYDALREAGYKDLDLEYLNMEPLNGKKIISLTDPGKKEEALMVINRRFINNQHLRGNWYPIEDQRLTLTVRSHYTMEILFRHQDPEKLGRFLTILLAKVEKTLGDYYSDYIQSYVSHFETYRINSVPGQVELSQYTWAKAYLDGKDAILIEHIPAGVAPITRVVSAPPPPPRQMAAKTVSLIIIAGAVFCAVFLAFALEAVKNIKKDGTVRVKIREALGKEPGDEV